MTELPKTFDPADIESRWYAHWENNGLFRPERPDAQPFTIVNPPPNVTGSLHIGHALDNTLQDIVIRYERLRGKDALWVVGTDHAGIATQMVVERQLNEKQQKRTDFTRDEFVAKVWEWKAESGGAITRQLRRLGCSMDWANERFTMDEGFSKAVIKTFVELHKRGLLYRDKRLVNWDPHFRSAISDLEVETVETKGGFWRFRYPLADGVRLADGSDHIVVATTRPETMLADMAVAVHPEDPRYKAVIGKDILQPITGRRFKVVADEHADPELGSGAVKMDDRGAAEEMTDYLISLGHRSIAFLQGPVEHRASARREEGFRAAMARAGAGVEDDMVLRGDFNFRSGLELGERVLTRPDRPTAIFASNDDMALGVLITAIKLGIAVPDELSVCGFDDAPSSRAAWPQITTIRQPKAEMAGAAVDILVDPSFRRNGKDAVGNLLLPHELVIRGSTAAHPRR